MKEVVLCADSESIRHPGLIGLAGEELLSQPWLKTFSSAQEARDYLRSASQVDEVWVASSDDVDAINAAAAFKRDGSSCGVYLLAGEDSGSLKSRSSSAGIEAALTQGLFAQRYARCKQRYGTAVALEEPAAFSDMEEVVWTQPASALSQVNGAFLLPVVSGSGGAGKSTVAALAAAISQERGHRTLLVDFDLQFGDMGHLMGLPNALPVDEALGGRARLDVLEPWEGRPALLAAPRRLENSEGVMRKAGRLLDQVSERFDVIVANTGADWQETHAVLLERATRALFLVDQRASSLRACKHALELCARCGIATGPFVFALNRCSKGSLFTSIDVSCALEGAQVVELADGGRDVDDLLEMGSPGELLQANNELVESLRCVLAGLLPSTAQGGFTPSEEARPSRGLFGLRRSRRRGGKHGVS